MKLFYENKDYIIQSYESVDLEFPEHIHDHVEIFGDYIQKILQSDNVLASLSLSEDNRRGNGSYAKRRALAVQFRQSGYSGIQT